MFNYKTDSLMKELYLLAIALLSLASCQQEDIATNGMYSDEFMSKLKFNTVNLADTRAGLNDGLEQTTKKDNEVIKNEDINIGIFAVRIARASRCCLYGFGFCDFRWFPKNKDVEELKENHLYDNSFRIQKDVLGNKFVDLELAEKPVGLDTRKLQPLVVEEELESFNTVNGKEEEMTVPQGTYSFDSSIGKFGGYRIPLK